MASPARTAANAGYGRPRPSVNATAPSPPARVPDRHRAGTDCPSRGSSGLQGLVRSAPADADLLAPLVDKVGSAVGGELVGPVPQAEVELDRGTGEDDLGPLDGTWGGQDRPVADPQRPGMPGVVGPDQQVVRLGGVQPALASGDEAHQQLVDPIGGQHRIDGDVGGGAPPPPPGRAG